MSALSHLFFVPNKDTYPPFKNGLYMEEYFIEYCKKHLKQSNRKYIPVPWTNFQIESWFQSKKNIMQAELNQWVLDNPSPDFGYYTVTQYDDGPLLTLPPNTIRYGACSGDIPLPLIYEDKNNSLDNYTKLAFSEKKILCSFVGTHTHNVRRNIHDVYKNSPNFKFIVNSGWTPNVSSDKQNNFIQTTLNSKFGLAPRGYGRSSFRFFEIFKLGCIPIYVWDDIEWLPYKDVLDYSKICISINSSKIADLEGILLAITEEKYKEMFIEYEKVKYLFELEGMSEYIVNHANK